MLLTMKEQHKIEVIQGVMDEQFSVEEGAKLLNRSTRQIYRMLISLRNNGLPGLVHGNKGRASPRKISEDNRKKIIELAQGKLKDINDTHLAEILEREEKLKISRQSLRQILRSAGIAPKLKRRKLKHRSRRARKEAFGMMIQIDASIHDWLEGRGPKLSLVGGKDDATNVVWALFEEAESTWAYFHLMEAIFTDQGLPLSLYSDRHTIFYSPREPTVLEQLKNTGPLTQFGRAMQELGVSVIPAYSPQAKGRIENQWKTFQDRLVVELRLANASSLEEANKVLKDFLVAYNKRFSIAPKQRQSVFRKAPLKNKLDRILCLKDLRVVAKDHTISFEGLALQIPSSKKFRSIAQKKVEVLQLKDGSIEIIYKQMNVATFSPEAVTRMVEHKKTKTELKLLKKAA